MNFFNSIKIIFFIIIFSTYNHIYSQNNLDYFLPNNITYNNSIPTPQSYFGFMPGEYHLRHEQIVGYIKLLSETSDRIIVEEYGRTNEKKPLLLLTISTPDNLKNIEEIKSHHKILSDPGKSSSLDIEKMPIVVWLGYSVHGNEASGANSVPLVLYHLAAANDKEIENLLSNMIILVDPTINPDGLDRFATWVNMHRGEILNPDPTHREHTEYWPSGRGNHYWADLNRDWLFTQHPESKSRIVKFHEWMPNVLTDHHEMGRSPTYFFQPGVPERTNPLTPKENYFMTKKIGEYHAKKLDSIGTQYFSEEIYDDYNYGKGSTYPDINGCIGILFEQGNVRGHLREFGGDLISFPWAIRNQFTTALSTIQASHEMRIELLNYQKSFYTEAIKKAKKDKTKGYVFSNNSDPVLANNFIELLNRHSIDVYNLKKELKLNNETFSPGNSFIVPVNQPNYGMVKSMFQKTTSFKDSIFYDISAWTFPLAFNLPFEELGSSIFENELMGSKIKSINLPAGYLEENKNSIAYVFKWDSHFSPNILNRILELGIKAKVATELFEAKTNKGVIEFSYGTILIPLAKQNRDKKYIQNHLSKIAQDFNTVIYSLTSGLNDKGIDLGGIGFVPIKRPKVMMLVGPGISSYVSGQIWQLLDQRTHMAVTLVESRYLDRVDLNNYTSIILPDGGYNNIDSNNTQKIISWLRNGGNLISVGNANYWLKKKKLVNLNISNRNSVNKDTMYVRKKYADKAKDKDALTIPGSIFEANLDITHPVGYGYNKNKLHVFVYGNTIIQPSKDYYSTPLQYGDRPLVSGYVSNRLINKYRNTASVVTEKLGKGNIIMFTESPNFRSFWYATNKLLLNSIFFGSIIN